MQFNGCTPLFALIVPRYTFKTARVCSGPSLVAKIFRYSCKAEIGPPIIKAISVYMVNMQRRATSSNYSVHIGKPARGFRYAANGIANSISNRCPPCNSCYKANIIYINYCLSTLGKWHIGIIAFNADLAYLCIHLAAPIRWCGPVEGATSRPVFYRTIVQVRQA